MFRGRQVVGAISVNRTDVGRFADKEVELLQTFAEQAVIAIENVRLFTELQARTTELTRSVEQLRALSEVGQAVSSTLDLETVLSTIVSRPRPWPAWTAVRSTSTTRRGRIPPARGGPPAR